MAGFCDPLARVATPHSAYRFQSIALVAHGRDLPLRNGYARLRDSLLTLLCVGEVLLSVFQ